MKFKVKRSCASTGKISLSVSFHRYFQVFQMNLKICFDIWCCKKLMNSFEKIFKTVAQKFFVAKISVTSPTVIYILTRELLADETKNDLLFSVLNI